MTGQDPLLKLAPEDYSRNQDHGEFGGGYSLRHSREDFKVAWRFLGVQQHGACVVRVAGTERRPGELQQAAFAPGQSVQLRPEPDSPDGPDTIEVWDEAGLVRVGHIAGQSVFDARALLFGGDPVQAVVLWDWRTEQGVRTGLNLLIARSGVVKDLDAPARSFERPPSRRTVRTGPVVALALVAWAVLFSLFGLIGAVVGGAVAVLVIAGALARPQARGSGGQGSG